MTKRVARERKARLTGLHMWAAVHRLTGGLCRNVNDRQLHIYEDRKDAKAALCHSDDVREVVIREVLPKPRGKR